MSDKRETTLEYEQYDFPSLLNSFIDADNEAKRQAIIRRNPIVLGSSFWQFLIQSEENVERMYGGFRSEPSGSGADEASQIVDDALQMYEDIKKSIVNARVKKSPPPQQISRAPAAPQQPRTSGTRTGSQSRQCGACAGTGRQTCSSCGGRGYHSYNRTRTRWDNSVEYYQENIPCSCSGGQVSCYRCGGSGRIIE
jgi:hypothetical protein